MIHVIADEVISSIGTILCMRGATFAFVGDLLAGRLFGRQIGQWAPEFHFAAAPGKTDLPMS
jgi:hypothetical protein